MSTDRYRRRFGKFATLTVAAVAFGALAIPLTPARAQTDLSRLGFRERLRYRHRYTAIGVYPMPELRMAVLSVPLLALI